MAAGGQPGDTGTLAEREREYAVSKVSRVDGKVVHQIEGGVNGEVEGSPADPLPAVGATVTGKIDWEHRYRLMRTHTALHILCGVVWRDYGAKVTGGDMRPGEARMDFELEQMERRVCPRSRSKG